MKKLLQNGCNAFLAKLNFIEQVKKSNTEKVHKQGLTLNAAPITCYDSNCEYEKIGSVELMDETKTY